MLEPLIKIRDLSIVFAVPKGYRRVVNQLNLDIHPSRCVGLVGESGSGKSLTALSILQLLPMAARVVEDSAIWFSSVNLLKQTERQMRQVRGLRVGMIFQDAMAAFNPVLTIGQQMDEVLKRKSFSRKMRRERALHVLDRVGLTDVQRCYASYPHQLSGGMRQRAMIAMALVGEPELILADEPTTALDVTLQAQILDLLRDLREKEKLSLLFITHDLSVASHIADSIVVMKQGEIVENSPAESFFRRPNHPYSRKLLEAVPHPVRQKTALPKTAALVQVSHLNVYFQTQSRTVKAVDDVSFSIESGKTLALVGESGSGKSTLARAMIRLLKPTGGQILFEHQDVWRIRRHLLQKMRKNMQIIFQDPYASLNPRRMIAESIAEGLICQKVMPNKKERMTRVDELLRQVGLPLESKWRYPHEFSGGERQRICIARAVALKPQLLILDEPTSALDVSMQQQILALLLDLQQHYTMTYLLITHDLGIVAHLAHRVIVLNQGRIVEQGETHAVLQHPQQLYTQKLVSALPSRWLTKKDDFSNE